MLVTTIIISYNTAKLTAQAVKSVVHDARQSQIEYEVIVVDNASIDNSVEVIKKLKQQYPEIKLIQNQENLGFAKANNQAIKQAKGEYLFLLNSDTQVKPSSLLSLLQAFNQDPSLGVASAYLITPEGRPQQSQGGDLPRLVSVASQMFFLDDLPFLGRFLPSTQKRYLKLKKTKKVGWVAGTAMMIKNQVIDTVGLLDEEIFMYAEDMDFCLRARQIGFQVAIVPKAQIVHYGSASSSSARAIEGEFMGLLYLFKKHLPSWQLPLLKLVLIAGASLRVLLFAMMGKKEKSQLYKQILANLN